VDPGTLHTGYGIVDLSGSSITLVTWGRISPPKTDPLPERLKAIFLALEGIIKTYEPSSLSLEDIFVKLNPKAAFKLAAARGVVMLAASLYDIPVYEYPPKSIKHSVCGYGGAEKTQVAFMVGKTLGITEDIPPDSSDALAAAITQANTLKLNLLTMKGSGPNDNPDLSLIKPIKSKSYRNLTAEDLRSLGYKIDPGNES
jgi:crossover junction endodeoxyribonuclease RuvC